MKKLFFFLFILLIGCSSTKETFKDSTFEKTTYKRDIDTTLKALNPLQGLAVSSGYTEPVKIKTKYYTFESEVNFATGIRTYNLTPTKDSIDLKVKVKERIETSSKKKTVHIEKKSELMIRYILLIGFVIFLGLQALKYYIKK